MSISLASCGETLSLPEPSRVGDLKILSERSLSQGFLKHSLFCTILCNPCKPQGVNNFSSVIPLHFAAGCCPVQRSDTAVVCRLFHSARSAQQSAATSSHRACICRDIGRWIGDYLGRSMQTNATLLWSHFFLAEDLQTTTAVSFRGIFQQVAAKCSGVTPLLCADCSTVQDRLSKVQQLQATERAFAAILADGLVTTWGDRCRQTPRCCGLIFFWQRTSRQLQRCHSAAFSSRLLPNAAE